MLAMIRVNLVGGPGRRKGPSFSLPTIPNVAILLFVLVLVVELGVLYTWYTDAAEASSRVHQKLSHRKTQLKRIQEAQKVIKKLTGELVELEKQTAVFEELTAEKQGPLGALSYLSFILAPRDPATYSPDKLLKLEAAGWNVRWDPTRAWFTRFREKEQTFTLEGEALEHDDVAEVQRRLESSAYFREVQLVIQEEKSHQDLEREFIYFKMTGSLIYLIEPVKTEEDKAEATAAADAATKGGDVKAAADGGSVEFGKDKKGAVAVAAAEALRAHDADEAAKIAEAARRAEAARLAAAATMAEAATATGEAPAGDAAPSANTAPSTDAEEVR